MNKIKKLWDYIVFSDSTFFYRSKKALILITLLSIVSFFWKSASDGSIVALIWSNIPWAGPVLLVALLILMFFVASKRIDKF